MNQTMSFPMQNSPAASHPAQSKTLNSSPWSKKACMACPLPASPTSPPHTLLSLTLLQLPWPPCRTSNAPGLLLPRGLCTCRSLHLEQSFHRHSWMFCLFGSLISHRSLLKCHLFWKDIPETLSKIATQLPQFPPTHPAVLFSWTLVTTWNYIIGLFLLVCHFVSHSKVGIWSVLYMHHCVSSTMYSAWHAVNILCELIKTGLLVAAI